MNDHARLFGGVSENKCFVPVKSAEQSDMEFVDFVPKTTAIEADPVHGGKTVTETAQNGMKMVSTFEKMRIMIGSLVPSCTMTKGF